MRLSMMWRIWLCRSRRSMPSIGYYLHRPPNMVTVCRLWGFSGGTDNQKRWNIEYIILGRNKISSLWPLPISLPCFCLNHSREKGLTTKWFMLVGSFKYVVPRYYSPCVTDLQRAIFIYFLWWSFFISRKKWTKNPLIDDAQSFKLATDHESIRSFHGSLCGRCCKVLFPLLFSCPSRD